MFNVDTKGRNKILFYAGRRHTHETIKEVLLLLHDAGYKWSSGHALDDMEFASVIMLCNDFDYFHNMYLEVYASCEVAYGVNHSGHIGIDAEEFLALNSKVEYEEINNVDDLF